VIGGETAGFYQRAWQGSRIDAAYAGSGPERGRIGDEKPLGERRGRFIAQSFERDLRADAGGISNADGDAHKSAHA
jgi:hypothetical protein